MGVRVMDDIEALLNGAPDDEAGSRVLADSLRSKRNAADWFSMSTIPQLSNLGKESGRRVNEQARSIGTNSRITRLAKTRRAQELADFERDREYEVADRELEYKRKLGGDAAEHFRKREIQELKNEGDGYSSSAWKNFELPGGVNVKIKGAGEDFRILSPSMQTYRSKEDLYAAEPNLREKGVKQIAEAAGMVSFNKKIKELSAEEYATRKEQLGDWTRMEQNLNTMIGALDNGAFTHPVGDFMPTWRASTATYESAEHALGLAALKQHKLTPVSDNDLKYVMSAAAPNLGAAEAKAWALHKKEMIGRLKEAEIYLLEVMRNNYGEVPGGQAGIDLRQKLHDIAYGGNFEYADPMPVGEIQHNARGDRESTAAGFKPVGEMSEAEVDAELRSLGQ